MKIISYGFIFNGKNSFLKDFWNILDFSLFLLTSVGYLNEKYEVLDFNFISLRAIRILRMIKYFKGLQLSISSLFESFNEIMKLIIFYFIFLLFFGLIGVKFFKGGFYYCNIEMKNKFNIKNKTDCFDYGGDWLNKDLNFDNIINSISTLFQISNTEGWLYIM